MKWWAGWNNPGCLPDNTPDLFDTWEEAHAFLKATIGEWLAADRTEFGIRTEEAAQYAYAFATLQAAEPGYPVSVFYKGQVLWIADLV
jgi:hypothetical protein